MIEPEEGSAGQEPTPEPDLSLFVLPTPEEASGALPHSLPEPPRLRHGVDRGKRPTAKARFWTQLVAPQTFRPSFEMSLSVDLDALIPPERMEQLEEWIGLYREPGMARQPVATWEALYEKSPQFSLRNLFRYEKDAWPDHLLWKWKTVRDLQWDLGVDEIRTMKFVPEIPFITDWLIDGVDHWQELRGSLVDELEWKTLAKRTDPRDG